MTKLTSALAILAALGLTAPALAQDAQSSTSTSMAASGDITASTSVDATTSTSGDVTASSAEPASSAPSTTTDTSVNITTEQKTEIHQAITEINVQPAVNVNFDINVGVVVPKTVVLTPLPARVVKIFPHYKGFLFFLLPDGRIVIVDPASLKIVLIIVA